MCVVSGESRNNDVSSFVTRSFCDAKLIGF